MLLIHAMGKRELLLKQKLAVEQIKHVSVGHIEHSTECLRGDDR